jgi:secretory lipase
VKYRTEDERGAATATVTTVLVPKLAWTGPGPRPLLSYQTAEDGVAGRCAPSYALRSGLLAGFSDSVAETSLIGAAVLHGWAVTVPDYEGPQSEFLVSGVQARGVLDGIRAARAFAPATVSEAAPIGVWGYSGGSLATITAAQLQPTYAPDVHLSAIAVGGLVADIRTSINAFDGSFAGGAVPMGINGFLRHYPELNLLQYLNASGRRKVARTAGDCIVQAAARYPFLKISSIVSAPDALDAPPVVAMLDENSPLFRSGVPQAPIYHYQAVADELAPIGPARALLHQFCAAGVVVQSVEPPGGEHVEETIAGSPGALQFLARRFAGDAPVDTCATIPT